MKYYPYIQKANPDMGEYELVENRWLKIPQLRGVAFRVRLAASKPAPTTRPDRRTVTAAPRRVYFPQAKSHEIRPGDTLQKISKRYYGRYDRWAVIRDANPDIITDHLDPGDVIVIPRLVEDEEE